MATNIDFRKTNGLLILQQGSIITNSDSTFTVKLLCCMIHPDYK